jgi:ubiquinone/menaquinone biosynthesis C-methylase UbiE
MSRQAQRFWEAYSSEYQQSCQIPVDVLYRTGSPNEAELQLIGPVAGKRVLELGCGGAQSSVAFAKQGAIVTAVDITAAQLDFARDFAAQSGVGITSYQRDVADLSPIASESQEIAFSAYAFGYVDDLAACFRETYRVLESGGLFVWGQGHPFTDCIDGQTLTARRYYFERGKRVYGEEAGVIPFAVSLRALIGGHQRDRANGQPGAMRVAAAAIDSQERSGRSPPGRPSVRCRHPRF